MIVETYKIRNTRIEICDDAIVTSQAEIDRILDMIAKLANKSISWSGKAGD
ncbi:MAG: hypothetical protein A4E53_01165 [Pelotomaculum sp. PtaB.Bin104]|nr:MAG: hypothetical protein A4E53_01165 [Pelotomaculum sp. PtaB.Bin104]